MTERQMFLGSLPIVVGSFCLCGKMFMAKKSVWQTHTHPPLSHTHICLALTYTPTIGCLKLQVSFRKRATNYRALLRKMTSKDKVSRGSSPPCSTGFEKFYFVRRSAGQFIEICENYGRVGKINVEK